MRRLLTAWVLLGLWFLLTAASAQTVNIANGLVTFLVIVVLPVVAKYVKLDGPAMAALVYVLSFAVALVAALLSGELSLSSLNGASIVQVLMFATALYGVQQVVFQLIKDHSTLGALVK